MTEPRRVAEARRMAGLRLERKAVKAREGSDGGSRRISRFEGAAGRFQHKTYSVVPPPTEHFFLSFFSCQ